MKVIKNIVILVFLVMSNYANGQHKSSKVKRDNNINYKSNSKIIDWDKLENLGKEMSKLQKQINELDISLLNNRAKPASFINSSNPKEEKLKVIDSYLKNNKAMNASYIQLFNKLSVMKYEECKLRNHCKNETFQEFKKRKYLVRNNNPTYESFLKARMEFADEKQSKKSSKGNKESKQFDSKIEDLDKELEKQYEILKNQKSIETKNISLDDFLEQNEITDNVDFLEDKTSETDDFLEEKTKKDTNFQIKSKEGKQGVIDDKGEILIPFEEWNIIEYKDGIAKTIKVIEKLTGSYEKYSIKYYAKASIIQFVDSFGNILDFYYNFDNDAFRPSSYRDKNGHTVIINYELSSSSDEFYDALKIAWRKAKILENKLKLKYSK